MGISLQMGGAPPEQPLPSFRKDLEVYKGPDDSDGSPTYNVFDPVRAQFFKLSWAESLVVRHMKPGMTAGQLAKRISENSTIEVTAEELQQFYEDAKRNRLLDGGNHSADLMGEYEKMKNISPLKKLMGYIFLRIPILNPDHFLECTLPIWRILISKPVMVMYALITFVGVALLMTRFDEFIHTFTYFFNFEGLAVYFVTIAGVKVIHEFSHAYMAKHHGVRVPKMGIILIIIWPLLYTDVTDSWKMDDRKKRLSISIAGVVSELIIAGMCTLGWALSDPGVLQSAFFIIASITWISTVLVNINPGMRFDGYYILSDLWGIDNLQLRGFAVARWFLRKTFLGLDMPPPEDGLSKKRIFGLLCYSIYAWFYRLFLYLGISVMIYTMFAKIIGAALFFLELGMMIGAPLIKEYKTIMEMRGFIKMNKRIVITTTLLVLFLVWAFVPLPHLETFPAITVPVENQTVYVAHSGVVSSMHTKRGATVKVGDPLIAIYSKRMDHSLQTNLLQRDILQTEINVLSVEEDDRSLIPEKKAELAAVEEYLQGLRELEKQNMIKATVNGTVYHWDENLDVGQSVTKDQVIAELADITLMDVMSFVPEDLVKSISVGDSVIFRLKDTFEEFVGTVAKVSPIRAEVLNYPQLASIYQRDLPVVKGKHGRMKMVESYYNVEVELKDKDLALKLGTTGEIIFRKVWRSKAVLLFRWLEKIFWKESGF